MAKIKKNADDDLDEDIREHADYDDVKSAIMDYVETEADRSAAVTLSHLSDEDASTLEEQGFDWQNAVTIGSTNRGTAVNEDIIVDPYWEKLLGIKPRPDRHFPGQDSVSPQIWDEANFETSLHSWLIANGYEKVSGLGGTWPGGMEVEISTEYLVDSLIRQRYDKTFVDAVLDHLIDGKDLSGDSRQGLVYWGSSDGDSEVWAKISDDAIGKIKVTMRGGKTSIVVPPADYGRDEDRISAWMDYEKPGWQDWEWIERVPNPTASCSSTRTSIIAARLARGEV